MVLYDEISNKYIRKKEINQNSLSDSNLFFVKEYGEYISVGLNVKSFSKFDFKGYVVMFVLDGSGIVSIDHHIMPLTFGDLLIFNGDSSHVISNNLWRVCYIILQGANIYKIMTKLFNGKNVHHISNTERIYTLFTSIYQSLSSDVCSSLDTCSYVLQLFSNIIKYDTFVESINIFESKALSYIENNYMKDIGVEDMAKYCGYSTYCFIRKFKKMFGETPYNYLNTKRITYAKQLLVVGELSIKEIAKVVGFNSFSNFCVAFKNKEHITPKEYQNSRR